VTTETLTVETAVPAVEALEPLTLSGVPTRICVEGQAIDTSHHGIKGLTVTAQRGTDAGLTTQTDEEDAFVSAV